MRLILVLTILLLVPLTASALPAPVPVVAAGFNFVSPALVIPAGTTVEWTSGALPHTVTTAADLNEAVAGRGNDELNKDGNPDTFHAHFETLQSFAHTFDTPGTYAYHCEIHFRFGMVGTIVVT